ncbi:23S rRNA (adenine(2030)-N(6))-methyltransferase RlmJ [Roseibium album]|uniref:23S rRNA (adenine(2030)-N(6))-methyltransferase RlmJ n=1 Tax=Roseibium album TaxID=311410 RepID=UPI002493B7E1|nr:23S rRNA (adenine(2030)-N(6))-methyltransferase RlmJ [Roseibium album]
MNYRHAYHAGNIGDVLKHTVLARLIVYFQRKDKAFRILDTHAGIGRYDLTSEETRKTGEWQQGIGKILNADIPLQVAELLSPWLDVVRSLNPDGDLRTYPGSPDLSRHLMRTNDRLTLTELHPQDFEILSGLFSADFQVKTIHLDGWLAMGSFLPPKEKRGFVFIDPAYEVTDEFDRMTGAVLKAWKKWTTGTYALWYPLKDTRAIRRMHEAFGDAEMRDVLSLELSVGKSGLDTRMLGSGMTLINPPFTLADEMSRILPWYCDILRQGPGTGWDITQLIGE